MTDMTTTPTAYLEHVALPVRDIHWHLRFFEQVFGLGVRACDGPPEQPRQCWLHGGLQLIARPGFDEPEGRLAHLGLMCTDQDGAIAAALALGAVTMPQGRHWLRLPDGLALELLQARPAAAVAQALAVDPRMAAR